MNLTFLPNQTVTAKDLNAIATDLGASSPEYVDGSTYATETLNSITESLVSPGVSIGGFEPSVDGSTVTLSPGVAFFSNGRKFRSTDKVILTTSVTDGYVYLLQNADGTVDAEITETPPPDGALLIALLVGGAVDDRRTYATSRVADTGGRAVQRVSPIYGDPNVSLTICQIRPAFPAKYIIVKGNAVEIPTDGTENYIDMIIGRNNRLFVSQSNGTITLRIKQWYPADGNELGLGSVELR